MNNYIDLRSDTVTKPSTGMRKAIYLAEVGDDVYKEDPTVNKLEELAAEILGKESALFVSSGVMGNQISLNLLTNPGDEVICEKNAHIFQYESGSPAALSGIQLLPIKGERGIIKSKDVEAVIRPTEAYYMPRTKVVAIENTHNRAGGTVYPLNEIKNIKSIVKKYKLNFHLDGARLWNASIASGVEEKEFSKYFNSVSACLSKGLGAPVGSVIAGSKSFIKEAYRLRKAWGGGMRQTGILAAAGIYALKNNRERLFEDHQNAKYFANEIKEIDEIIIDTSLVETNIVLFQLKKFTIEQFLNKCKSKGLLLSLGMPEYIRVVFHLDISKKDTRNAINILKTIFK